ncbi:MAG: hypothetical protein FWE78_06160 [Methanimicrococcus sp.]|nr:hypothetical protein [Methanimicrococcus sp.]
MSKKGLLIGAILVFLLIASAMALENRSADENFTSQEYPNKSIHTNVPVSSASADFAGCDADNPQNGMKLFSALHSYSGN